VTMLVAPGGQIHKPPIAISIFSFEIGCAVVRTTVHT
jgi:hypothetical protein